MDKKKKTSKAPPVSGFLARFRGFAQACAVLLTNPHLPNLLKGQIYRGKGKTVCVPGLNCYSCPAATGACPIGAVQSVIGSSKFKFSYYVTGTLILLLTVTLPLIFTNEVGMGNPFFCKYLCPQGVLEGAIPLSLASESVRSALGSLFTWKSVVLGAVVVLSLLFYRPFCKWLCPLGAFYALFNRVSLTGMQVDAHKCVHCGRCEKACKMDVDVTKTPDHPECIRCGMCVKACPTGAVSFRCGLSRGAKEKENPAGKQAVEK